LAPPAPAEAPQPPAPAEAPQQQLAPQPLAQIAQPRADFLPAGPPYGTKEFRDWRRFLPGTDVRVWHRNRHYAAHVCGPIQNGWVPLQLAPGHTVKFRRSSLQHPAAAPAPEGVPPHEADPRRLPRFGPCDVAKKMNTDGSTEPVVVVNNPWNGWYEVISERCWERPRVRSSSLSFWDAPIPAPIQRVVDKLREADKRQQKSQRT